MSPFDSPRLAQGKPFDRQRLAQKGRAIVCGAAALALVGVLAYLRDPPWAGRVTAGLRVWQIDGRGDRFRWTTGRASFFVPSDATAMTLKFRPMEPLSARPITVDVSVDDRPLTTIALPDPLQPDPNRWVRTTLPLPRRASSRRFRRIDLRVSRRREAFHQGIQMGEVEIQR